MNLFYVHPEDLKDNQFRLHGQEAHHASRVLRLNIGDEIHLTDGQGNLIRGKIGQITRNEVNGSISHIDKAEKQRAELILALGVIKKRDRLEFAVEKAVELGVSKIILFRSEHTEKSPLKLNRLELIAQSAMKQSLRCYLPQLIYADSLSELLQEKYDHIYIAHEKADPERKPANIPDSGSILLLIGPEGGFSEQEVQEVLDKGGRMVSLGKHRLRAETAAITLISYFI
jgi:16S rRNA (uracil1498-N3)-methyltransferase